MNEITNDTQFQTDETSFSPHLKARVGIVIINYRTPDLVKDCLVSLSGELEANDARVVVVDNHSDDGSPDEIAAFLESMNEPWTARVAMVRSRQNTGFSGGNNIGITYLDAPFYLLLNSDTLMREGSLAALLASADIHHKAAIIAPRLEDLDGTPQQSVFRLMTPLTEFLAAAQLKILDTLFAFAKVARPVPEGPTTASWVSFACVLVRRRAIDDVGLMDEGYFMYFEDTDYCRSLRKAGWEIVYDPSARVVHLRGGSSPVKKAIKDRKRPPAYYYASRTRYYRKVFGLTGPTLANIAWHSGRAIAHIRLLAGRRAPETCQSQARDHWLNWRRPLGNRHAPEGN